MLFTLSQQLRHLGYQVDIYVLRDSPTNCFPELREGLKVIQTQRMTGSQIFSAMPAVQALEMASRIKGDYDIIHAHNFPANIAAMFTASKHGARRTPFIWQCNEPHRLLYDKRERNSYVERAIKGSVLRCFEQLGGLKVLDSSTRKLDGLAASRAHTVTVLSNYAAGIVSEIYGVKPIIIHPGVDRAILKSIDRGEVREKYGVGDAPLILTVSRLWPSKNLETAIRAFKMVLRHSPNAFYIIVGEGPSERDLLNLSRELGVEKRCIFVHDSDVGDKIGLFYAACDVFLFTAVGEPWGLSVLEAMIAARPVVASADGGLLDLVKDHKNGILVNPFSASEIAERLVELIGNPSLANQLGRRASETADRYSWEKMATSYERIYQHALSPDR